MMGMVVCSCSPLSLSLCCPLDTHGLDLAASFRRGGEEVDFQLLLVVYLQQHMSDCDGTDE